MLRSQVDLWKKRKEKNNKTTTTYKSNDTDIKSRLSPKFESYQNVHQFITKNQQNTNQNLPVNC